MAFGAPPARAAVTEAWVHRYSNVVSNSDDHAFKVVRDAAGDIIVAGTTDDGITQGDMLTIKYSGADGSVLWLKRYNGPANGYDAAHAVAVDGTGNVVVTGYSYNGTNNDYYYTAKYATADGALLWEKRYNGPGNYNDYPQAVVVDGSGNVLVTGYSATIKYLADGTGVWTNNVGGTALAVDGSGNAVVAGGSDFDFYTAKYAATDGALLWAQRYNGPDNGYNEARAVAVDGSGNVMVTERVIGSGGDYIYDYYTAKYAAANGALLWEKRYNGPANRDDNPSAVAVDGSGNVMVTGYSVGTNGDSDCYTAKYAAADGGLLWEQRSANCGASAVAVDGSCNVVVTGSSSGDFYTAKYAAANGALLWEKRYNNGTGNNYDNAYAVAVDGSGNVVVTGRSAAGFHACCSEPFYDWYTAKYAAADGALLWEKRYDGPANSDDRAQAVAVDNSGNVVVTGYSENSSGISDYYTAKYAAANGALLWEQRYNGPANGWDEARAVAVDGSGNVAVTGYSSGTNGYGNYYTVKYAAADGALLWEKRYNGPANAGDYASDYASAVAVDGSGNVVVTGSSYNTNGNYDYYTVKYAAANGALLWELRGPGGGAAAVAVDGSGNVVVTGYSGAYPNTDYYTAKYAAADGTLLWEQHYNGPANSYDFAGAVVVDASGNVLVTGSSSGTNGYSDYYTAKYAAADGALLWEKRYHGPGNNHDQAQGVAVDGSGNVVVAGSSWGGTNGFDYYTAKYAAADGALLWEKRYNGPANVQDSAYAVAVDGSGNVVVTGSSWNGTYSDYYTAKYASADGALLWEQRYNGPDNGNDIVAYRYSLALGPNGMVAITGSSSGDYATVVYRENLPPISIALVPTGIRLRFTGIPGRSYTIERAPAVIGPWTTIDTQTAPASGLLEYLDAPPPPDSAFYRTVQP